MENFNDKYLHIVSFDVPFPCDYGGVIDVFFRIKQFHSFGVKIILHCFEYGRGEAQELEKYCHQVFYYPRQRKIKDLFTSMPFIVKTRINSELVNRLTADNYPVFLEGLHTAWYLDIPEIAKKKTFVRVHNIEHDYYLGLSKKSTVKQYFYFVLEAIKLKFYEKQLKKASHLFCVKEGDVNHFKAINPNTTLIISSFDISATDFDRTTKPYILFHGNLSVEENADAAFWFLKNIDESLLNQNFIISGKNPSKKLELACAKRGVTLIANPSIIEMNKLVEEARVHVLYTAQSTGIKLKLLNALNTCGHLLVNHDMIVGTGLNHLCTEVNSGKAFSSEIVQKLKRELNQEEKDKRIACFDDYLNVKENNLRMLRVIFKD